VREAHFPGAQTDAVAPLQVTVAHKRTLTEARSWLPEHSAGQKSVNIGGRELPGEVGATLSASPRVLCLAPGEWLLISDEKSLPSEMLAAPGLAQQGLVLTNVTDGLAVLAVRGSAARDVLSKACGLDFHEFVFTVGRCARTRLAQISVIVDCLGDPPGFDLYVPRSYLRYLADWLEDAGVEFGGCLI
jgi:sarcosine oxidase subunit gamma